MSAEKGDDAPKPVGSASPPPADVTALFGMACAYLVLNIAINTFNKWSLGVYGFHFPVSVTLAHQVFSFAALTAWLKTCDPDRERTYRDHWEAQKAGLVFTGIMTALNLGLNNGSLVLISLSANQLITASMPLFTTAFTFALEPADAFKPHLLQLLALPAICLGVMMVVHQEHSQVKTNALGLVLAFLSVVANSLRTALSSKLLDGSKKLDILAMQWTTSPVAALALVPFALGMEGTAVLAFLASNPVGGGTVLLAALGYNLFLFHMIQVLKGVSMNIVGNVKVVLIIMMSHYLFGDVLDVYRVAGALVTFLGVGLYTAGNYRMSTAEGLAEQAVLRRHYASVMTAILVGTVVASLCFLYVPVGGGDSAASVDAVTATAGVGAAADGAAGGGGGVGGVDGVVGLDTDLLDAALSGDSSAAGGKAGEGKYSYDGGGGSGGVVGEDEEVDLFDEEPREDIVVNHPGFVKARPLDPQEEADLFDEDR